MSLFMVECELLTELNSVADNSTVWLIGSGDENLGAIRPRFATLMMILNTACCECIVKFC